MNNENAKIKHIMNYPKIIALNKKVPKKEN